MDRERSLVVVILLFASVLLFVGCSRGGQAAPKTAPPATTAAVSLSLKDGWTASNPWGMRVIEWKLEPLKLEGSEGRGTTLMLKKQYSPRLVPEKGGFRCYLDEDSITDLRPGTWRISSNWGPKCDVALKPGGNSVHFTYGLEGCLSGTGYPGT